MPAVIAAGSAGGTQIVIMSNEWKTTFNPASPEMICNELQEINKLLRK